MLYFYDAQTYDIFVFFFSAKFVYFDNCFPCSIFLISIDDQLIHYKVSLDKKSPCYKVDWKLDFPQTFKIKKFVLSPSNNNIALILSKKGDVCKLIREDKDKPMQIVEGFLQLLELNPIIDIFPTSSLDMFIALSSNQIYFLNIYIDSVIQVVEISSNIFFTKVFSSSDVSPYVFTQKSDDSLSLFQLTDDGFDASNSIFLGESKLNSLYPHDNGVYIIADDFELLDLSVQNKRLVISSEIKFPLLTNDMKFTSDFDQVSYVLPNNDICIINDKHITEIIPNFLDDPIEDIFFFTKNILIIYSNKTLYKNKTKLFDETDIINYKYIRNDLIIAFTNEKLLLYSHETETISFFYFPKIIDVAISRNNKTNSIIICLIIEQNGIIFLNEQFHEIDITFNKSQSNTYQKLLFEYPILYCINNNIIYSFNIEERQQINNIRFNYNSIYLYNKEIYYTLRNSIYKMNDKLQKKEIIETSNSNLIITFVNDIYIQYIIPENGIFIYYYEKTIKQHKENETLEIIPLYFQNNKIETLRNYIKKLILTSKNKVNDIETLLCLFNYEIPFRDPNKFKDTKQIYQNLVFTFPNDLLMNDENYFVIKEYVKQFMNLKMYLYAATLLNKINSKEKCAKVLMKNNFVEIGYIYCVINNINLFELNIFKCVIESLLKIGKIFETVNLLLRNKCYRIALSLLFDANCLDVLRKIISDFDLFNYVESEYEMKLIDKLNMDVKSLDVLLKSITD